MRKKLFWSFLCSALFLPALVKAQLDLAEFNHPKDFTPKSPEAWDFQEYGNIPVNHYNGSINLNIPLFVLDAGRIQVPVSLNYSTKGVKVESVASWVGTDWHLDVGGSITRVIHGESDLESIGNGTYQGWANPNTPLLYANSLTTNASNGIIVNGGAVSNPWTFINDLILHHLVDAEADEFSFTCGNFSGKFFFNKDGSIEVVSEVNVAITPPVKDDGEWTIITEDGYKYIFGNADGETTYVEWAKMPSLGSNDNAYVRKSATSWKLKSIEAPTGEVVNYTYSRAVSSGFTGHSIHRSYSDPDVRYFFHTISHTSKLDIDLGVEALYLDKITYETNAVKKELEFVRSSRDTESGGVYVFGHCKLNKIYYEITNKQKSHTIKKVYNFNYLDNGYRLWLSSLQHKIIDPDDNSVLDQQPAFSFEYYNEDLLPNLRSNQYDYFGFYNGVGANEDKTRLAQQGVYYSDLATATSTWSKIPDGADRTPNNSTTLYGYLEKVIYPTGGSSQFTYEPHSFTTNSFNGITSGAGIRVKIITHNDALGGNTVIAYGYDGGKLMSQPRFSYVDYVPDVEGDLTNWAYKHFTGISVMSQSSSAQGSHVGYDEVTQSVGDGTNGYTKYYYYNQEVQPVSLTAKRQPSVQPVVDIPGIPYNDYAYKNGKPIKLEVYNSSNELVQRTSYTYEEVVFNNRLGAIFKNPVGPMYKDVAMAVDELIGPSTVYGKLALHAATDYSIVNKLWLTKTITKEEFNNSRSFATTTTLSNTYTAQNKLFKPRSVSVEDSRGVINKLEYWYPIDYSGTSDPDGSFISGLLNSGITGVPVLVFRKSGSFMVQGRLNTYNSNGLLKSVSKFESTPFVFYPHSYDVIPNGFNKKVDYLYSSKGDLDELKATSAPVTSFLWSSLTKRPVLIAQNVEVENICYQGFEETNYGTIGGYAGEYCLELTAQTLSVELMNNTIKEKNDRYKLDAWINTSSSFSANQGKIKVTIHEPDGSGGTQYLTEQSFVLSSTNGDWQYHSFELDIPTICSTHNVGLSDDLTLIVTAENYDATESLQVDEMRLYPKNAKVVSFNYDSKGRLISTIDQRSQANHFDFDLFGRLEFVKDFEKNILQFLQYNYKQ